MADNDTGETSRVIKTVERTRFEINKQTGQMYVMPNTNDQTHGSKCTDTYVTVATWSEIIISLIKIIIKIFYFKTGNNDKCILCVDQLNIRKVQTGGCRI